VIASSYGWHAHVLVVVCILHAFFSFYFLASTSETSSDNHNVCIRATKQQLIFYINSLYHFAILSIFILSSAIDKRYLLTFCHNAQSHTSSTSVSITLINLCKKKPVEINYLQAQVLDIFRLPIMNNVKTRFIVNVHSTSIYRWCLLRDCLRVRVRASVDDASGFPFPAVLYSSGTSEVAVMGRSPSTVGGTVV
jgi:hypothetical protein